MRTDMHRASRGITVATIILAGGSPAMIFPRPAMAAQAPVDARAAVTATMLPDAVDAIERATGGKVLEIRFEHRHGIIGWDAVVTKQDVISQVNIAAQPGARVVVIAEANLPAWMATWRLRADRKSIFSPRVKVRLSDAIRKAEAIGGGPAIDAGLAKPLAADNDVLAYNIELLVPGKTQRVVINAETGNVIENPDVLLDPWTPEKEFTRSVEKVAE
jgi:hypothetical protein